MVWAPGAAPPRQASARLRWPRARRRCLSALPSAPPPRSAARTLAGRVTARRCTAANKPALAGPGEIKNKTNKLAKRPESWGGACAAARPGPGELGLDAAELRWQARSQLRPPGSSSTKCRASASGLQGRWRLFRSLGGNFSSSAFAEMEKREGVPETGNTLTQRLGSPLGRVPWLGCGNRSLRLTLKSLQP